VRKFEFKCLITVERDDLMASICRVVELNSTGRSKIHVLMVVVELGEFDESTTKIMFDFEINDLDSL
jgi:hypothetical protein